MTRDFVLHPPVEAKHETRKQKRNGEKSNDIDFIKYKLFNGKDELHNIRLTNLGTASFAALMMLSVGRSSNIHVHLIIDLLRIRCKREK